jgi:hypothetical protein
MTRQVIAGMPIRAHKACRDDRVSFVLGLDIEHSLLEI